MNLYMQLSKSHNSPLPYNNQKKKGFPTVKFNSFDLFWLLDHNENPVSLQMFNNTFTTRKNILHYILNSTKDLY